MTKTLTPEILQQHIYDIADALGVDIYEYPLLPHENSHIVFHADRSGSNRRDPVMVIQTITDEKTYAVALHELGHFAAPNGSATGCTRLVGEAAAWEWAQWAALEWTPIMAEVARLAFQTYEDHYKKRAA